MNKLTLARMAAFIDGEGCIDICIPKTSKAYGGYLSVAISNTDLRLLRWCKKNFGGKYNRGRLPAKPQHKQCYNWYIRSAKAAKLLKGCMPFFLLKRGQASIALRFQGTVSHSGVRISERTRGKRATLQKKLRALHSRRGNKKVV